MLQTFRRAGLAGPTLLSLAALVFLVGLGTWQMQRKSWKDGLVAQIVANTRAAPVDLTVLESELKDQRAQRGKPGASELSPRCLTDVNCHYPEYKRVRVRGRFEFDDERYLYAPDPRLGPGYHVYSPLILADGRRLMVNRGFVPHRLEDPATRIQGQVAGDVEVVGLLRAAGTKGSFTPDNDPARNIWYWRDLRAMAACDQVGANSRDCTSLLPAFLDAEAEPANPGGWPRGGTTNLDIPNRHLEYALTWYGLAATLIGVYIAFVVGRWRDEANA